MKLFLLEWLNTEQNGRHSPLDCTHHFVIRAQTEEEARKMASNSSGGDEGPDFWLDPSRSSCTVIHARGNKPKVMMKAVR